MTKMCAGKELVLLILLKTIPLNKLLSCFQSKTTQLLTFSKQNFLLYLFDVPDHLSRFQNIQGKTLQCGESGYKSDLVENSSKINGNNFLLSMPLREIDNTKKLNSQKY